MLATLLGATPASACGAPGAGGNPVAQCAGVGNPINVMTGNKYQREEDMPALPGVLGLELVRHYNSAFSGPGFPNGPLGRGWRLSYETEVVDLYGKIQVLQADGSRVIFERDPKSPTGCSTPDPANGSMALGRQRDGKPEYTWTWTDGRKLHFNAAGKLDRITAPTGEAVRLLYDSENVLVRVIDPQGRSLNLVYYDRHTPNQFHGVRFIDTPVGRFSYEYGSALPKGAGLFDKRQLLANLVRVRFPDQFDPARKAHALSSRGTSRGTTRSTTSRIYHHEDPRSPWLMTGISIETIGADGKPVTTRYATFGYDDTGRAILSTHAGNVDKVALDNHEAGKTVLTNSLGQKTVYRYTIIAGEYRLLEVRGAGCALCGEPNLRYAYDGAGRLIETTRLSVDGDPVSAVKAERDRLGRITRIGKVVYPHGKPGPAQLQVRFEYRGTSFAPALVARPSVVPGRERVTRIEYNGAGQPLSVTESGWSPSADGKRAAERIERTIRYRYAVIDGRSLLVEIDGPLPNGKTNSPVDSDVTIFEYDHVPAFSPPASAGGLGRYERREGLLTRVIAPGNLVTEVLERDAALRPTRLRRTDGDLVQETHVTSNWRSAPLHIKLAAGALRWTQDYEYDALGQLAAVTMPGKLRTTFAYDSAGRRRLTVLPDGSGIRSEQNTEDRVVRTTRLPDALAEGGTGLADLRFTYDHAGDKPSKLAEIGDAAGLIKRYSYDELGRVALVRSALGIAATFAYNPAGLLANRTDAAGSADAATIGLAYDNAGHATGITAGNGVKTLRRYDDFGRKVLEADPDHGITIFRHDAAGNLVARIDETLVTTRFTYDSAGRLLAMGADDKPNLVQYRYRGRQLQGVIGTSDGKPEHATERTDYERDAFGRVTRETRWLANVAPRAGAPAGFKFVTTSEYDEAGRLAGQTLPDGHRLQYRYAPAGVSKASGRHPGQLEAILFDDDVVVTDIEQTAAGGLTGYTMGNGARERITLDSRGRIKQLRVVGSAGPMDWWRRITAWFSGNRGAGGVELYRQVNRYDANGRITGIDREMLAAEPGRGQIARNEAYSYDQMNRLSNIRASDGSDTRYAYDKGGNRLLEMVSPTQALPHPAVSDAQVRQLVNRYAYAERSNRLIAITTSTTTEHGAAPNTAPKTAQRIRDAWFYHPTGVPLAQLMWTDRHEGAARQIVYDSAERPVAVYANQMLSAHYHYDVWGERIAKTVYSRPHPLSATSLEPGRNVDDTAYFLYRDQRLAAETNGAGRIMTHYIYLYGKPVAKVEMEPNRSPVHQLLQTISADSEPHSSDTEGRVYSIITDHRGAPQIVLDATRSIVWQAETDPYGRARVKFAAPTDSGSPFVMNLRLPGQVFDAETNLHYNYFRDYDPALGRYVTPDPLALAGGTNPYAYVDNNPLTGTDPLGLYQIDVHYYMTYFLAVTAGVDANTARTIALATQYIDENNATSPTPYGKTLKSAENNLPALVRYHFTQDGYENADYYKNPLFPSAYDVRMRTHNPSNPQLTRLKNASVSAKTDPLATSCSSAQFFGEYLHAFEDTFAHRDNENAPYSADHFNLGLGHTAGDENPDYTYNHSAWPGAHLGWGVWDVNEDRTYEMEHEVYGQLQSFASAAGKKTDPVQINSILAKFNAYPAHDDDDTKMAAKIAILNDGLKQFGYTGITIKYQNLVTGFDKDKAAENRQINLGNLDPNKYPGTILPKGTAPLPK